MRLKQLNERVETVQDDYGKRIPVLCNPGKTEAVQFFKNTGEGARALIDHEGYLYIWPAYDMEHDQACELLGVYDAGTSQSRLYADSEKQMLTIWSWWSKNRRKVMAGAR